ncbi:unnamed protein product [Cercopithifilaria johnstoni]|uniref:Uncharacterized protein n=1 Tax=Cercopithifilaria johnstoni TaxID=2874296 RepID=A0A8J2LWN5_9BILA|nr:unnamed protein product [Cercopithifilaria johnstoni]
MRMVQLTLSLLLLSVAEGQFFGSCGGFGMLGCGGGMVDYLFTTISCTSNLSYGYGYGYGYGNYGMIGGYGNYGGIGGYGNYGGIGGYGLYGTGLHGFGMSCCGLGGFYG